MSEAHSEIPYSLCTHLPALTSVCSLHCLCSSNLLLRGCIAAARDAADSSPPCVPDSARLRSHLLLCVRVRTLLHRVTAVQSEAVRPRACQKCGEFLQEASF